MLYYIDILHLHRASLAASSPSSPSCTLLPTFAYASADSRVHQARPTTPPHTHTRKHTHYTYTWYVDQCLGLVCVQNAASKILHTTLTLPTRRRSCTLLVSYRALSCLVVSRPCVLSCVPHPVSSTPIHSPSSIFLNIPSFFRTRYCCCTPYVSRHHPPFSPSPSVSHPLSSFPTPALALTHVAGTPMSYRRYLL